MDRPSKPGKPNFNKHIGKPFKGPKPQDRNGKFGQNQKRDFQNKVKDNKTFKNKPNQGKEKQNQPSAFKPKENTSKPPQIDQLKKKPEQNKQLENENKDKKHNKPRRGPTNPIENDEDKDILIRGVEINDGEPTTKLEFEKKVLVRPDDCELWVKYITFTYESEVTNIYRGD